MASTLDNILNTSIMSQAKAMLSGAEGMLKMARNAVKGMGQDGRFFRDSKRGACPCWLPSCISRPLLLPSLPGLPPLQCPLTQPVLTPPHTSLTPFTPFTPLPQTYRRGG